MQSYIQRTLLLLWALLWSSFAQACALDIDTIGATAWSGSDGRGYDVFDASVYYQPLSFDVRAIEGSCAFYVTVAAASVGNGVGLMTGSGGQIDFQVYRDATGALALRSTPLATEAEVITGFVNNKGAPVRTQVAYSIPALQIVGPGTYSGQITIAAYEGKYDAGILRAQTTIPLSIVIPSIAELSFATDTFNASRKQVSVDFGYMYESETKGITMRARGNGGYRLLVSSQNGGVMRQRDPLDISAVPYTATIDGKSVQLGRSEVEAASYQGITSAQGNIHRMDFRIGSLQDSSAGDYEDTVYITILSLR
jgi:hypothetical protein